MKLSFELKINSTSEKIWEYYVNVDKWYEWEEDLEDISLKGNFETNTLGMMKLQGMPPMDFKLTSVIPNKEFIDETVTPMGTIAFGHFITKKSDGLYIRHEVSIDNDDEQNKGILSNIFSDVPTSMFLLKKVVEK